MKFQIGEREGEKMKPRFLFAFALVLTIVAGTLPMVLAHGQDLPKVVLQMHFNLAPFPKPALLMPGSILVPFSFGQRISLPIRE